MERLHGPRKGRHSSISAKRLTPSNVNSAVSDSSYGESSAATWQSVIKSTMPVRSAIKDGWPIENGAKSQKLTMAVSVSRVIDPDLLPFIALSLLIYPLPPTVQKVV